MIFVKNFSSKFQFIYKPQLACYVCLFAGMTPFTLVIQSFIIL